jgi:hypothetical protein
MKSISKFWTFLLLISLLSACGSGGDEDCTKTITIPQFYTVGNQTFNIENTQEVPCNFPEPTTPQLIEPPELSGFTFEVLSFTFTPDTGNNTSRLQFEIRLNNPNDFAASGVPVLTINRDGIETTGSFSNNASVPCLGIPANGSCSLTYDQQESLDLGMIGSVELVSVDYFLTN